MTLRTEARTFPVLPCERSAALCRSNEAAHARLAAVRCALRQATQPREVSA